MHSVRHTATTVLVCVAAWAATQHEGTWKMNVTKSKGVGDITSRTMKITQAGADTYAYEFEDTRNGKTTTNTDKQICDGKEHRSERSASTYTCTEGKTLFMVDGKPALEYIHTYSPDGKTLTNTITQSDKEGKVVRNEVRVFERQ